MNNFSLQQTVLKFLNAVISNAPSSNLRIYYQQEMENAGFNADTVEEVSSIKCYLNLHAAKRAMRITSVILLFISASTTKFFVLITLLTKYSTMLQWHEEQNVMSTPWNEDERKTNP